ncbi:phospholipase A2 inhibitor and Ly6/PLAUR domain-containing protein-like [Heteronotia binoei]|uniref:phospholipase A2 inhibitor and Ly6/PLAUR domain-containing protein-like n=1 Tax=Heteronotia binoei TaxID=13085 RepID=UPI002930F874|nr:phospholipase A2 inhibitor and Ly6/PLAUR domain-containing protein-like [Heteronotia binoei]XP_060114176.1 phospholipase A2 inhibitor and Ly6/PLAUR domain-containing protein-like [Heteronotia binoei]
MKILLSICLLWAFFSSVASLKCASCQTLSGRCDNIIPQECQASEDACLSYHMASPMFGGIRLHFKSCVPSKACLPGNYTVTTTLSTHILLVFNCCSTDLCNSAALSVQQNTNSIPNGFECPVCYSLGQNECQKEGTVNCIGEETQCFSGAGSYSLNTSPVPGQQNFAFRGCTTKNTCALPTQTVGLSNGGIIVNITKLECSNATSTPTTLTK